LFIFHFFTDIQDKFVSLQHRNGRDILKRRCLESLDDEEEEEPVAVARAISTLAPRKDFRGGPVVDWVINGWEEPACVVTPDLFAMVKELPGRPTAGLASTIGRRLRVPSPECRQLCRRVAVMSHGYRQAQQEVRNLLPVGPCSD